MLWQPWRLICAMSYEHVFGRSSDWLKKWQTVTLSGFFLEFNHSPLQGIKRRKLINIDLWQNTSYFSCRPAARILFFRIFVRLREYLEVRKPEMRRGYAMNLSFVFCLDERRLSSSRPSVFLPRKRTHTTLHTLATTEKPRTQYKQNVTKS